MNGRRLKDIGEFGFIAKAASMTRLSDSVIVGIGDDAAVLRWTKDKDLLFTTDMLIEGRHFKKGWLTMRQLGRRAVLVNLSDI